MQERLQTKDLVLATSKKKSLLDLLSRYLCIVSKKKSDTIESVVVVVVIMAVAGTHKFAKNSKREEKVLVLC
jgi:hypothetical protein